ncbi:MAG: pre-peptidase C-terminal domain-containing protein [Myxococcales bacterium]|nr:pre-peptidase C-terminal domain-containing protein [Myxococcales bacterium]
MRYRQTLPHFSFAALCLSLVLTGCPEEEPVSPTDTSVGQDTTPDIAEQDAPLADLQTEDEGGGDAREEVTSGTDTSEEDESGTDTEEDLSQHGDVSNDAVGDSSGADASGTDASEDSTSDTSDGLDSQLDSQSDAGTPDAGGDLQTDSDGSDVFVEPFCEAQNLFCREGTFGTCNESGSDFELPLACADGCDEAGAYCQALTEEEQNGSSETANHLGSVGGVDAILSVEASLDGVAGASDWYSFTVTQTGVVTIGNVAYGAGTATTDTELWFYDSELQLIQNDDDGGPGNRPMTTPRLLEPGEYFVRIEYYSPNVAIGGNYRLEVLYLTPRCEPGSRICSEANVRECSGLTYDPLATCSEACLPNDGDAICQTPTPTDLGSYPDETATEVDGTVVTDEITWFSFEVSEDTLITVQTSQKSGAASMDTLLFLCTLDSFNLEGCGYFSAIIGDDNSGQDLFSQLEYAFHDIDEPTTYILGVEGVSGGSGEFTLNLDAAPLDGNDTPSTATQVSLPYSNSHDFQHWEDQDWYRFNVSEGAGLTINWSTAVFIDGILLLCNQAQVDAGCSPIGAYSAYRDNGFEGESESITTEALPAGPYYLRVTNDSFGTSGDYNLSISEVN